MTAPCQFTGNKVRVVDATPIAFLFNEFKFFFPDSAELYTSPSIYGDLLEKDCFLSWYNKFFDGSFTWRILFPKKRELER